MITCKKATELIEKKEIFGLTPLENLSLNIHTLLCFKCKKYQLLTRKFDETLFDLFKCEDAKDDIKLSEIKKEEIKDNIKKYKDDI